MAGAIPDERLGLRTGSAEAFEKQRVRIGNAGRTRAESDGE